MFGQERIQRFEFGAEDDDLEAMQRDFLKSSTKPAARAISQGQPPAVLDSSQRQRSQMKPCEAKSALSGDILGFAKSMVAAMDEFESSGRRTESKKLADQQQQTTSRQSKKQSVFAQRRLAQQTSRSQVGSGSSSSEASNPEATFLPKLMAPISEHRVVGPVQAPEQRPRETGFPSIPVDFAGPIERDLQGLSAGAAHAIGDSLSQMRQQISQENSDRIQGMSEADILEAQAEIRAMASSETIQRLLRRRQNPEQTTTQASSTAGKEDLGTKHVRFEDPTGVMDEDDDAPAVPPPPPAEWVDKSGGSGCVDADNNDIGTESEFYRDMKRKYFPSEMLEEAKLAWILGHNQARSPMERAVLEGRRSGVVAAAVSGDDSEDLMAKPVSHLRFAFDGQIMTELESDTPTHAGLHHHGDNPDKPGYTIPELLHLSRSTVPAQRAVAMSTLACIMHKVNVGAWDIAQASEVYAGLLDWQAELYFVQGIYDASKTGRAEAVVALWTFVVEVAQYKTLVRLTNGGQTENQETVRPSAEINMLRAPAVAQGVLVDKTFRALSSLLEDAFLDRVCELVDLSLVPEQQLTMVVEMVKLLMGISDEFGLRIHAHGRLPVLLQNRYPYLMNN
ncbi:hypothetical protein GGI20_002122 [Coemansia sp. BCRC 34301]|nr:hypothetical protein GGI20_002122 [Coemansia sp. BCRC 34301]